MLLKIAAWVLFALFGVAGIAGMSTSSLGGLGFLGMALLTFPHLNDVLERYLNLRLPLWVRGMTALGLIILIGAVAPN